MLRDRTIKWGIVMSNPRFFWWFRWNLVSQGSIFTLTWLLRNCLSYHAFICPTVKHRPTKLKVVSLDSAGGWTPPVTVPMVHVLLHLSRKENKSETAPPSVAARSSQRKPGRARATEHTAAQVSGTKPKGSDRRCSPICAPAQSSFLSRLPQTQISR